MVLVGALLIAGIGLIAVEAVGYKRGGYNSEFWRLPLDDKIDRVAVHRWEWWWVSIWELVGLFLMTGGLAGLTYLLAAEGEPILASVAFGGYLLALVAWVFGLIAQAAAVSQAATQRTETGETPAWIHPFWEAGYLAEGTWIIGTNLVYAIIGVAILQSGLVGAWSGWAAVGLGALIPVVVLITRVGFPQLGLLVPFILGVALVIKGF
jgi:hypothetical protein